MTGFVNQPDRSSDNPFDPALLADHEGLILQRGGEELVLHKSSDRFTVRAMEGRSLSGLSRHPAVQMMRPIAGMDLTEVQVEASQLESVMVFARSSDDVRFASHVYEMDGVSHTPAYLSDELTVQFAPGIDLTSIQAIATSMGLQLVKPIAGAPQAFIFHVTKDATANPVKLANRLAERPEVLSAEPDVIVRTQPHYRPQVSHYGKQWYLQHGGGDQLKEGIHLSMEAAWDITRGDRSVIIAVADDGFDLNHPDFQGKGKMVAPKDMRRQDAVPMPEADLESHGTAVAGLAIAEENGAGIVGVAPGCAFMPIRTSSFLNDRSVEELFDWATEQGAAVVSCSWGATAVHYPLSTRQRAAISRAATEGRNGKGCVVVFAAGNTNRPVSGTVNELGWPSNVLRGPTEWLNGFAVHPDVITVSACTSVGEKAAYSNWGTNISVCAPSNNVPPDVFLPETGYVVAPPPIQKVLEGKGMVTSDRLGSKGYTPGDYTESFGGTSAACPLVAGVAALVLSVNPDLTAREVKQLLQNTADKILDSQPDPQFGASYGTYDTNGHSRWFGYGKVNAHRAVQAAQQQRRSPSSIRQRLRQSSTGLTDIPDNLPLGMTSALRIDSGNPIQDIQISLDIQHSYLGDLEISLESPTGLRLLLQGRTLGNQTRLNQRYNLDNTPALRQLLYQTAAGVWKLTIVDCAPEHTGWLNRWELDIGV
ncbi:MAG: S8 family serine peptidase [Synechococcales cyanobacterium K44_A2020_017]|nr:S8 family serine peptidase [Synechococcales cyanobacterium K32_A2020_035]MBF2094743.1 S8 family serine peptidase [Synechococcales cyanobacterium K44_A2020_017]